MVNKKRKSKKEINKVEKPKKVENKDIKPNIGIVLVGLIIGMIIGISVMSAVNVQKCNMEEVTLSSKVLSSEDASRKAIEFINDNLVRPGTKASIISYKEVSGVYMVNTSYEGSTIPIYISKDGELLFLQALPTGKVIERSPQENNQEESADSCEKIKKEDKPILEAFVVSRCPFGLQMQRILDKIVSEIPEMEKYIIVRYIGSVSNGEVVSMHGPEEAEENLRQICIREEQGDKYWDYVGCYISSGNSDKCILTAGIDNITLAECMEDSSKGLSYAQTDFGLDNNYNVRGSPTLIVNEQRVSEFNFGGRTAEAVKEIICCGFNNEPDFCNKELSKEQAATGLSESYSRGESSGGSCN